MKNIQEIINEIKSRSPVKLSYEGKEVFISKWDWKYSVFPPKEENCMLYVYLNTEVDERILSKIIKLLN